MERITFSVDSRLLRELGERLVGRPHIALAELVKNAYDADATKVIIRFAADRINILDNGHGMDFDAFANRWMRVGSTHKETQRTSPRFGRPLTGSKGVGRLSVQLLAQRLEVRSVADGDPDTELRAEVNWEEAVEAGLLTEAPAYWDKIARETSFPSDASHGTLLILRNLNQHWTPDAFVELAREIWPLQPPFRVGSADPASTAFSVELDHPSSMTVAAFGRQMRAVLDLWTARLIGELLPEGAEPPTDLVDIPEPPQETPYSDRGKLNLQEHQPRTEVPRSEDQTDPERTWDRADEFAPQSAIDTRGAPRIVRLSLQFQDHHETVHYRLNGCHLDFLEFQIRVFSLAYRQPRGVRVEDARRYLRRFGGVHVYDSGFHLPYYGPDTDWLRVEIDHSHRLSRSALLPQSLQRTDGLRYLPTNSRLFGVVNVNTLHEQRAAAQHGDAAVRDALRIQVSRDRLAGNRAYRDLVVLVRWALDFYAIREAARAWSAQQIGRETQVATSDRIERLDETLDRWRDEIPRQAFAQLSTEIHGAMRAADVETRAAGAQTALLSSLATAGISALAYEHEVAKQFELLSDIARRLRSLPVGDEDGSLTRLADDLDEWLRRARATRALFSHLLDESNRTARARFKAKALIDDVARQVRLLARGATVHTSRVPDDLRLPHGGYAEWSSLFQNLFINAINAMADSPQRRIDVTATRHRDRRSILIQDTGVGVDLEHAEVLFEPFARRQRISADRAALGLGGSGLGLTIVRMLAGELKCSVRFVRPDAQHATAVEVAWRENE